MCCSILFYFIFFSKLLEIKKNATIALEVGRKVEKENKDRQQAIEQQAEHIQ